jgi:AmiR/NasT family two-component response regulator
MASARTDERPRVDGATSNGAESERLRELVSSLLEQNAQLRTALESRIVIEQAKGVLAERFGLEVDEAFRILRRASRNHRMSIHALAARVVASRETPPEIEPPSASARERVERQRSMA